MLLSIIVIILSAIGFVFTILKKIRIALPLLIVIFILHVLVLSYELSIINFVLIILIAYGYMKEKSMQ